MKRARRGINILTIFAVVCAAAPAACSRKKIDAVILITMESVRERDTSEAGGYATLDTTPVEQGTAFAGATIEDIEDIRYHGMRFSNAFSTSGSAFASLVSLHTGRPSEESGVYNDLDRLDDAATLAEMLSLRGVRCGAFVTRPSLTRGCGLERGFETYITKPRDAYAESGQASAEGAGEDARAWLDSVRLSRPDQPVFVWLHLSMPRPPFEPRDEYIRRFMPGADRKAGSLEALAKVNINDGSPTRADVAALHAACMLQDAAVASRFLRGVAPALQQFRSTMILFAGTNGEELGGRGSFGSARGPRESAVHVPLFVWSAGMAGMPKAAGEVVDSMDLTVTIANAFGVDPPPGARGGDLFEITRDPRSRDRVALSSWENRIFSLRTARERFLCNPMRIAPGGWPGGTVGAAAEELYDPVRDADERNNLFGGVTERISQLRALVERERSRIAARPPNIEKDPSRVRMLADEGIHAGHGHPEGKPPESACGGKN